MKSICLFPQWCAVDVQKGDFFASLAQMVQMLKADVTLICARAFSFSIFFYKMT